MTADQLASALRKLSVPERREALAAVDLPRSTRLGSAVQIANRARQLGKLAEVERALDDWRQSK